MHRLRLKFSRGEQLKYLSHLDLMRLWERALRRAGLPAAYSEGFSPHPKISLASPLAVGVTSRAELMDVFLNSTVSPRNFMKKVTPQLPEGIEILEVVTVNVQSPSLQSRLRQAEYLVELETDKNAEQITAEMKSLLAKDNLPWHHSRDTGERFYDLRPLIEDLWLIEVKETLCRIGMLLRCDGSGTGRPEQVARALNFTQPPTCIVRTKLIFA
ncbi:MAG: TIGR03936 family radical SAM-associated protein [Dehalococcoidia bacterium]|jgi:radical SAM-linked protein